MLRLFLVLTCASAPAALTLQAAEEWSPEDAARCAHLQRQLATMEDRLERQDGRAARTLGLIERQGALLQTMKKNLDRTGLKNVTTYNAKVDQYGPAIERYNNELLPDPVRRRYTFNAKAQRYNGDCANRAAS